MNEASATSADGAASTDSTDSMGGYYARRAQSYERIYAKPERQADLRRLEALLPERFSGRHVLEVACGTGYWTAFATAHCASWLATDLNPETMAIAQRKPYPPGRVSFAPLDAYAFDGLDVLRGAPFDAAFAGFWWSHVPLQRLREWLGALHRQLAPGARIVFLDNRFVAGSSTPLSRRDATGNSYQQRALPDGSVHEVLKNFPSEDEALAAIGPGVREARWTALQHFWLLEYRLA